MRRRVEPDVVLTTVTQVVKDVAQTFVNTVVCTSDAEENLVQALDLNGDVFSGGHQSSPRAAKRGRKAPVPLMSVQVPIDRLWLILFGARASLCVRPALLRRSLRRP